MKMYADQQAIDIRKKKKKKPHFEANFRAKLL